MIGLRLLEFARGGSDALNEMHSMHLMIEEKVNAAFEWGTDLMAGASADSVIGRYRQQSLPNCEPFIAAAGRIS